MSRSYRALPPAARAAREERRGEGRFRIVVRRARVGDVHPIEPDRLGNLLRAAPRSYTRDLRRVELRARSSAIVGDPFAEYRPGERAIVLYSLPLSWTWEGLVREPRVAASMRRARASVTFDGDRLTVHWPSQTRLGFWFWWHVLNHELGHHYRFVNRGRRGVAAPPREEAVADVHSRRLFRAFVRRGRARRAPEGGGDA